MAVKTAYIKNFSTRQHICEKIQCKSVSNNFFGGKCKCNWQFLGTFKVYASGPLEDVLGASLPMLCTITNGRYRNKQNEIFYFTIYQIRWRDCLVCLILAIGKAFKKSGYFQDYSETADNTHPSIPRIQNLNPTHSLGKSPKKLSL